MRKPAVLLLIAGLLICQVPTRISAQDPVRKGEWTQSLPSDWQAGTMINLAIDAEGALRLVPPSRGLSSVGSFTTAIGTSDWDFSHLMARWEADVPEGTGLVVETRARKLDGEWMPWSPLFDPQESESVDGPANRRDAKGGIFGENILALQDGRQMQARFTFVSAHPRLSPVLHSVSMIYLDASAGPTTQAAAAQASRMVATSVSGVPAPTIIPRAAWGADESWMDWPPEYAPVEKIVVHHTVSENDEPDPAATVRAIYYYHAVVRGWGDVGYNFLIDRYGNIYEGRAGGLDVIGGHTYGYNVGTLGIGNLGAFGNTSSSVEPSAAMLAAISELSAWTASRRLFDPRASVPIRDLNTVNLTGHRDYGTTACPGDYLDAALPQLRDWAWNRLASFQPDYAVAWGGHSTPPRMLPGSTVGVSLSVENAGLVQWLAGGANPTRLGYHWYDSDMNPVILSSTDDHRAPLAGDVGFGGEVQFADALLTAPNTPGRYVLKWDMVHEGITWFEDRGGEALAVPVVVTTVSDQIFMPLMINGDSGPILPQPTPEPTPDPTVTPEPPSPPESCTQLIENGGFETGGGWVLNDTPADAVLVADPVHAGTSSLRVGIAPGAPSLYSYSSADQTIVVPANMSQVTLSYWQYPQAADDAGDFQYVMVRDGEGNWHTVQSGRDNRATWLYSELDMTAFQGQTITLRFGAFNDGSEGNTSLVVDEVNMLACP